MLLLSRTLGVKQQVKMRLLMMRTYAVLALVLVLVATVAGQEPNRDEIQLNEFVQAYYQHPEVNKVVSMLEKAMKLKLPRRPGDTREPVVYFFARMAELHPELLRKYEALFDKADAQQRGFLIEVLRACGDAQTAQLLKSKLDSGKARENAEAIKVALEEGIPRRFDLSQPAVTGSNLDVRWMEFFISGDPNAVSRIADAVNAPEVVRARVLQWMSDPSSAATAMAVAKRAEKTIGLRIDTEQHKVLNLDDTDLLIMDRENSMGKARFDALKTAIPIELSPDDYMRIAVKGSALWSLSANAKQYEPVKKFLESALNDPRPRVRLACLRALAFAEFAKEDYGAAETHANRYLQETKNRDIEQLRMEASYELELKNNSKLAKSSGAAPMDAEGSAKAHERWVKSMESARAMAVDTVIWDDKDNMVVHWRTLYQAPDRYDVMQTAWEGKNREALYDKWRFLGAEQYSNFGFWISGIPDQLERGALNPALRGADILNALKVSKPNAGSRWTDGTKALVMLEYSPGTMRLFKSNVTPTSCKLWMDESNGHPLKAEISYVMTDKKEKTTVRVTQVFGGMNSAIVLERPAEVMDFSKSKKETLK